MQEAISNTSPLLYLFRIDAIEWLPQLFSSLWIPSPVLEELQAGQYKGYDVPRLTNYAWWENVDPLYTPSEWLALDLGRGELGAMALGLENPQRVLLLDDMLARRTAQAAGLTVWGTLRFLLEAKHAGLTPSIRPQVLALENAGMWLSDEIKQRILSLADEEA